MGSLCIPEKNRQNVHCDGQATMIASLLLNSGDRHQPTAESGGKRKCMEGLSVRIHKEDNRQVQRSESKCVDQLVEDLKSFNRGFYTI